MQNKNPNKVEKVATVFEKLYIGCGWLLINLFVLGFLCWGLYKSFVSYRVETNGVTTEGSVIALDHFNAGTYSAVVEFEADGQTYSFKDDTASSPPKYEIGETVTIRYDSSNPNIAQIDDGLLPLWFFPAVAVVFLIITLIVVNILGLYAWRRGQVLIDLF